MTSGNACKLSTPHRAKTPSFGRHLHADTLIPLAELGIHNLTALLTADGQHIISTDDLVRHLGPRVTPRHKLSLNRITLAITKQHEDDQDPLQYKRIYCPP